MRAKPLGLVTRTYRLARGFTLLELLVALAVIAVLAAAMVPAFQGMLSSTSLRGNADNIEGLLELAQQTAATRNTSVNLRIYQDPSAALDANGRAPFRALAAVIPSAGGGAADEFLAAPLPLAGDVMLDSGATQSSLLDPALGSTGLQPVAGTESASASASVRNRPYVQFTFLPGGALGLDPTQQWCLTLRSQNAAHATGSTGAPGSNFVTFVLDVPTGRVRSYQP